ncbi:UV-stimulated scaffold protein A-like [Amphiura filiformis]|uniref:UV-stimulated scaffold protein A-like n=1 Tax=Amphiura filiformis TaxID=82378 RepID=UPI003B21EBF0
MSLNLKKIRESGETEQEREPDGEQCLDHVLLKKLEDLIEKITTTGRPTLDEGLMKQIKKICKISDDYVEHTFHLVITQLNKSHCEIRLSAFQVINELFSRSHHFRELLVTDMQEFLELAVETDPDAPLPPPKPAAKTLKESALRAIQVWHNKFGKAYKKLALGYNFLKFQKKVNFENIEARSTVERRRIEERQHRRQLAEQQKVITILQKMQEKMPEIQQCLTQMENCFELLLPRQTNDSPHPQDDDDKDSEDDDADMMEVVSSEQRNSPKDTRRVDNTSQSDERTTDESSQLDKNKRTTKNSDQLVIKKEPGHAGTSAPGAASLDGNRVNGGVMVKEEAETSGNQQSSLETEDVSTDSNNGLRQHGLPSRDYNLTIRLDTDGLHLTENEDNTDILHTLDDHYRLITSRYLPEISLWMATLGKTPQQQDKLKRCIDIKLALKSAIEKYKELQVNRDPSTRLLSTGEEDEEESSDSDEEFEDVPEKEGYEPHIPEHLRAEYGLEPLPTSSSTKATTSKPKPPTSKKQPTPKQRQKQTNSQSSHAALLPGKSPKWHPLMETEHTLSDPASQAGTMADLMARAKAITTNRSPSSASAGSPLDPKKQKLLSEAPVVSFGVDLEHWEHPDKIQAPTILRPDTDHLVWSSAYHEEEVTLESVKSSMQTRVMSYTGSFSPVKWKCRAPMPSGSLCERMDRVKCPFHGRIIGRDQAGTPTNPEEAAKVAKEQMKEKEHAGASSSSPFDQELQRDVEAALGVDLGSSNDNLGSTSPRGKKGKGRGGKKGKGKAKKYPNLTDIKKVKNTSRLRLERKILNKNAIGRVAKAMNSIEKKQHNDRFANNFNYAYSN